MKNRISLKNISIAFEDRTVLENFSAEISENTAVMGTSGKGKTTLVRIIAGLEKPHNGEIVFENKPSFSFVFQEDRLFDGFNATDNVISVCKEPKKDALPRAQKLLEELLIPRNEQKKAVRDFSGGMKRRVALARALMAESDILILDEPFKGLDESTRSVAIECVKKHSKDKLVILVTHDKNEAELMGMNNIITV